MFYGHKIKVPKISRESEGNGEIKVENKVQSPTIKKDIAKLGRVSTFTQVQSSYALWKAETPLNI